MAKGDVNKYAVMAELAKKSGAAAEPEQIEAEPIVAAAPPEGRPVGRPRVGKRSNPNYDKLAVLVKKETKNRAVRLWMDKEPEKDMSDLVESLLSKWVSDNT